MSIYPYPSKEEVYEQYITNNLGSNETGKALQISGGLVLKLLRRYDIPRKKSGSQIKYHANHNFFSTWSENMAYCLGFITADGHVWEKRPFLTIGISNRDQYILEFIRNNVSPDTIVRPSNDKVQVNIYSKQIIEDLKKLGVTHDKTFNLKIDFDIPEEYWGDYLRGVFDGDGSIYLSKFRKNSKDYYYSTIVSASRQFLEYIKNRLGFGNIRIVRKKYFELQFSQSNSLKLFNIIYKNSDCFKLLRKYEKFLKINSNYNFWTKEEDDIVINHYDNLKELQKLLPKRTKIAIECRIRKYQHEGRINYKRRRNRDRRDN